MANQVLVFSEKTTNRIQYVFNFLEEYFINAQFIFTNSEEKLESFSGSKINYSNQTNLPGFHCRFSNLLIQSTINSTTNLKFLEQDKLAFIFFCLSRYEEYQKHSKDQHKRYQAKNSYLHKSGKLQQPIVDMLALQWSKEFQAGYPNIELKKRQFKFINSIDVDSAYQYKHKSLIRTFGGALKDLNQWQLKRIKERLGVVLSLKKDAFDCFDWIEAKQKKYNHDLIYFWLLAKQSKYDKNIDFRRQSFLRTIQKTTKYSDSGIHPSYASNKNPELLKNEIQRLSKTLNQKVQFSRQHYIKLHIPKTYQTLLQNKINKDFSMGYPEIIGFRAGTCMPFLWYDLEKETTTHLRIFPFQVMDVTLNNYMQLNPQEAKKAIQNIIEQVRAIGGTFISIFHNESLSNTMQWIGWREVYTSMLIECHGN